MTTTDIHFTAYFCLSRWHEYGGADVFAGRGGVDGPGGGNHLQQDHRRGRGLPLPREPVSLAFLIFTSLTFKLSRVNSANSLLLWEKEVVVSYYRFPMSVGCTFEEDEIQAIFSKTCPGPRTAHDGYIHTQFRQFIFNNLYQFRKDILNQMWPRLTSRLVVRSAAQTEGQKKPARRRLRWV